jgi:hypothetical protein
MAQYGKQAAGEIGPVGYGTGPPSGKAERFLDEFLRSRLAAR